MTSNVTTTLMHEKTNAHKIVKSSRKILLQIFGKSDTHVQSMCSMSVTIIHVSQYLKLYKKKKEKIMLCRPSLYKSISMMSLNAPLCEGIMIVIEKYVHLILVFHVPISPHFFLLLAHPQPYTFKYPDTHPFTLTMVLSPGSAPPYFCTACTASPRAAHQPDAPTSVLNDLAPALSSKL